ncbi:MAG: TolC family protein [Acidobacteriota bacterium]|jgi:outer membrane protein TolC|nr:TolC family protein [Acidobacteriota bacterium]
MASALDKATAAARRRISPRPGFVRRSALALAWTASLFFAAAGGGAFAQQPSPQAADGFDDLSQSPEWFPRVHAPYVMRTLPQVDFSDSFGLLHLVRDGRVRLSLEQLKDAVRANNLDMLALEADSRYIETDLLRAKGGGAPRGGAGISIPSSLFSGAIGAGVGGSSGVGSFSGGAITGGARAVYGYSRGSYDPSFALGFSFDRTTSPLNSVVVSGVPEVSTDSTALLARYSQAFPIGASLSVAFNNMRQSTSQRNLLYNPSFISQFSVSVTQQILNGFGTTIGKRFHTVAETERKIMKEIARQRTSSTFAAAETAYWDLAAARESVKVAEQSLAMAERYLSDTRQREEFGTMSGLDVASAESEVAARERDLVTARTTLQMREVDLKNMVSKDFSSLPGALPVEPADPLPVPQPGDVPDLQEALAAARANRPEIRQAEANVATQDLAVKYNKDLLRPTLLVFANFNSSGLHGNRAATDLLGNPIVLPGGLEQTFRQVRSWRYPEYAVGFTFSINIRNRAAEADYRRSKRERTQTEVTLERTRNSIAQEVREALIALVQSKAEVEAAGEAARLSALTLEAEEARLNEGVAIPYDVIRRRRDLVSAQFSAIQAQANYAKALVEMRRVTGADYW